MSNHTFNTQAIQKLSNMLFLPATLLPVQNRFQFAFHAWSFFFMFVLATPQFEWFKTMLTLLREWENYPIQHSMPILFLNPFKHVVFHSPCFSREHMEGAGAGVHRFFGGWKGLWSCVSPNPSDFRTILCLRGFAVQCDAHRVVARRPDFR